MLRHLSGLRSFRPSLRLMLAIGIGFNLCLAVGSASADRSARPDLDDGFRYHKALPAPTGATGATGANTPLLMELHPPRSASSTVWGDWESPGFYFNIRGHAQQRVNVKPNSLAGEVIYLKGPDGKVRSVNHPWTANQGFGKESIDRVVKLERGAAFKSHFLQLEKEFGQLGLGQYTLAIELPAGRLSVNGKPSSRMVTKHSSFEVIAMTPALRKRMLATHKAPAGITLEVIEGKHENGTPMHYLKLSNQSKTAIEYTGYGEGPGGVTNYESFGGDGIWRAAFLGLCGTGMVQKQLKPGQSATVAAYPALPNVNNSVKTREIRRPIISIHVVSTKKWHVVAAKM